MTPAEVDAVAIATLERLCAEAQAAFDAARATELSDLADARAWGQPPAPNFWERRHAAQTRLARIEAQLAAVAALAGEG